MSNKSCAISGKSGKQSMSNSASVSMNTSGLATALQKMAEAQMAEQLQKMKESAAAQAINPVVTIAAASTRMTELYERYAKLQEIGKLLNGVGLADPIPDSLHIEDVTITFRTKNPGEAGEYSEFKTASVRNIICAGDIYKLLSGEMGLLILTLEQELKAVHDTAEKSEAQYEKARKQWEAANPDRQITPIVTPQVQKNENAV